MLMRVAECVALAVMLGCVTPVLGQDIVIKTITPHKQVDVPLTTPPRVYKDESPADPTTESPTDPTAEEDESLVVSPEEMEEGISAENERTENDKEKFFLKSFRTLSNTNVILTTSTVFSSCVLTINTVDCLGRRKKRSAIFRSADGLSIAQESSVLDSSRTVTSPVAENNEEGKFAFTIWTQVSVTTTITTIWTNPSYTISLSYWCSVGFVDFPVNRCNG